jgi:hypothetical protein
MASEVVSCCLPAGYNRFQKNLGLIRDERHEIYVLFDVHYEYSLARISLLIRMIAYVNQSITEDVINNILK